MALKVKFELTGIQLQRERSTEEIRIYGTIKNPNNTAANFGKLEAAIQKTLEELLNG